VIAGTAGIADGRRGPVEPVAVVAFVFASAVAIVASAVLVLGTVVASS
jgi:hypothetical protein